MDKNGEFTPPSIYSNHRITFYYVSSFFSSENVPIVLVGNKSDLADSDRAVPEDDGRSLAAKWPNCHFMELTTMSYEHVLQVFQNIVRTIDDFENLKKTRHNLLSKEANEKHKKKCTVM